MGDATQDFSNFSAAYDAADEDTGEMHTGADRVNRAQEGGDNYEGNLEQIRDELDADSGAGTTLGTLVGAQLKTMQAEIGYQIRTGIPNKMQKEATALAKKQNQ